MKHCFVSALTFVSKTNQGLPCDTQTLQTHSLKSIHSDLFCFTANCAICQSHACDWCLHLISISLPKIPCNDVRADEVQTGCELHARWWFEYLRFFKCFFLWNWAQLFLRFEFACCSVIGWLYNRSTGQPIISFLSARSSVFWIIKTQVHMSAFWTWEQLNSAETAVIWTSVSTEAGQNSGTLL